MENKEKVIAIVQNVQNVQQQPKNVYQRALAVMGDLDYIQKDKKKVNNMYSAVTHDAVSSKIHPLLVKHGLFCLPTIKCIKQDGNRTEVCLLTKYINVDNPLDFFEVEMWGYGLDTQDKGVGKAVSYATKYTHLKVFVLETGDDPDLDEKTVHQKEEKNPFAKEALMSLDQIDEIRELIGDNNELRERILKKYEVSGLVEIPEKEFTYIQHTLKQRKATK